MTAPDCREPEIALVLSAERWVDDVHRHCTDHGGARVRFMVLDPTVAAEEAFDVLVASDRWPALTRPFVDALHERGRRVLLVGAPPGVDEIAALLGADATVSSDRPPAEVVAAVAALVPAGEAPARVRDPSHDARTTPAAPGAGPEVFAVGGPFGAGSTEVAIALAAGYARRGRRAALVDADDVTPSLAARLGLPLEPNLCTAVDAVAFGLGAVPGALFDLGDDWPAVLVGAPHRRSAAALRPADVAAVADVLAARFAPVVIDVSAGARSVHGELDTGAAVARRAAVIVAVGSGTPVGVVRLGEWVESLGALGGGTPVHLVVNRAPASKARRAEVAGELQHDRRVRGLTFLPEDARVTDAAWSARVVERGPFARGVAGLARALEAAVVARDAVVHG